MLAAPDDERPTTDGGTQRRDTAKKADERVSIPAGQVTAGSVPGDRGRDPVLEPPALRLDLGAFEIDRLPYPNDPRVAPRTGVNREQAEALCAQREGRLCTELEWERACKGPEGQPYAGGLQWDSSCASAPETCASGFGVLAMGGAMRELTSSDVQPVKREQAGGAAVRGARADAADVDHRCAHRAAVAPEASAGDLGFRCCYGERNAAAIASPKWLATFRKASLPASKLETMLASLPKLAAVASEVKYFREENAIDTVKRRGERAGQIQGLERTEAAEQGEASGYGSDFDLAQAKLTTEPLLWNPVPGEEIVIVAGQSGKHSFIVALHRFAGEGEEHRYRIGAALVMKDESGPIVLAHNANVRRRLKWLTCVGCYGQMGNIRYRKENRVTITQE